MIARARILFVDDEPLLLAGIRRTLHNDFDVETAESGAAAIEALQRGNDFAVVVSDLRMPHMDGVQLLRRVQQLKPDIVRVLFTGATDFDAAVSAINEGHIFRFVQKPASPEQLRGTIGAALVQHQLITAERVLLEQTLRGSIQALADVVALVHPAASGRASRVQRLATELAQRIGTQDRWIVEVSALLAHLGTIALPAATVEKLHCDAELEPAEAELVARLPAVAADLVAHIPRLESVREVLRYQRTHFDGTDSPPPAKQGTAIPLGARLLMLAGDFDALESKGHSVGEAQSLLAERTGWYDPELLKALRGLRGPASLPKSVRTVLLADVRPGMIFSEDVKGDNGLLLVARGQGVTEALLHGVREYWNPLARRLKVSVVISEDKAA